MCVFVGEWDGKGFKKTKLTFYVQQQLGGKNKCNFYHIHNNIVFANF